MSSEDLPGREPGDEPADRGPSLRSAVRAHPTAFIAPGAMVVGNVTLGARSSVWFNAVVRGDLDAIEIGEESNVQDNAVLHVDEGLPARVGRRVVVGHGAIVHGAEVEDGCLIGMGSILLSGAHIGAGSVVAAGALVGERKRIPPRSLVAGVPGKVLGPVSDGMLAGIAQGVERYVALSRAYLAGGAVWPPEPGREEGIRGRPPGRPDELEVAHLLGALASGPARLPGLLADLDERQIHGPGPGGGASVERIVAEWLRDEEEFWAARLVRLLAEPCPELAPPPQSSPPPVRTVPEAAARLARARAISLERLRPLPPAQWARAGVTAESGPLTVGEHVRRWVARDASHLRRLAELRRSLGA